MLDILKSVCCTYAVHPADVGGGSGEDGRFPVGVAARGGDEAGHTMDHPLTAHTAVQRTARVSLHTAIEKSIIRAGKTNETCQKTDLFTVP